MADYKKSAVYQIYPKSFYDSNGDGIGDLRGITKKLDYIKELGADYIWITPFFVSPQKDNGYDVENYYQIDSCYGTMEDFEGLLIEAEKRGIRLMLDMVFNHTSDRHEWFKRAIAGEEEFKEYYIFRKGQKKGVPPTNWQSKFGGSAWKYVEELDEYYLHLFDESQPDLNWENKKVRDEIKKILKFWMGKGVKGFRFDVINLISKGEFLDDDKGDGRRFYTDGPKVHQYLKELNEATFGTDAEIITVGEMSSTSLENCYRYAAEKGRELSMIFSFHHLKVDFAGNEKWVMVPYDFQKLKNILCEWQSSMAEHQAWNALFWCNHDQPRVVSRFGSDKKYWKESAKMLATVMHCLRGTPYIYQGEELGMTNAGFTNISQYRDVESINHFRILQEKGLSEENAIQILQIHSRDNSRTPVQWTDGKGAGFTGGTPWIEVNPNYREINAETQLQEKDSIFFYYKKLICLRKEYEVIAYGDFEPVKQEHPSVFAYQRTWRSERLLVISNFYAKEITWEPGICTDGMERLLGNYAEAESRGETFVLRPYECIVLYGKQKKDACIE